MASAEDSPPTHPAPQPIRWRQVAWISLAAAALIAALHLFPGRPPLRPVDFAAGGPDAIEFCDPQNPRIIAVAARSSSVTLNFAPMAPLEAISPSPVRVLLALRSASGRDVGAEDLISSPEASFRLFILSADLADFQTAQPVPEGRRGAWVFEFAPKTAGTYRVFADMTPVATGRELYASADLMVPGAPQQRAGGFTSRAEADGCVFSLLPSVRPLYAHRPAILRLAITRPDGGATRLLTFQGAPVHLAIFDEGRSGFFSAPTPSGAKDSDASRLSFDFAVSFPDPGRYVAWVRADIAGHETAVPFALEVTP